MLPPEWERRLAGTTDSERYFLHLMWRLAARDGDMVAAIADTTAAISRRFTTGSLNAILLSPDTLYAISFYDRSMVPADRLRERGHGEDPDEVAAYFDLAYQVTDDAVLVASSGWPMPGWTPLPSGTCWSPTGAPCAPRRCRSPRGRSQPAREDHGHYPAAGGLRRGESARERQDEHRDQRAEQAVALRPALPDDGRACCCGWRTLRPGGHRTMVAPGSPPGGRAPARCDTVAVRFEAPGAAPCRIRISPAGPCS